EVEDDAALVGVQVQEEPAALGIGGAARKRSAPPCPVAAGRLELDYVRAEIGAELRRVRGRDAVAALEHAHSRERARGGGCREAHETRSSSAFGSAGSSCSPRSSMMSV